MIVKEMNLETEPRCLLSALTSETVCIHAYRPKGVWSALIILLDRLTLHDMQHAIT